jgi:hypothetical protein
MIRADTGRKNIDIIKGRTKKERRQKEHRKAERT